MSLSLRQIGKSSVHGKLFQSGGSVVSSAYVSTHSPHAILTTSGGFFQLVDLSAETYDLFGCFVEAMMMDAPIRFVALNAATFATTHVHNVVFAFSHSRELYCGSAARPEITTLRTFDSRPSAISCRGNVLLAGAADGELCAWKANTLDWEDELLWSVRWHRSGVACLDVGLEDALVCWADFVVSIHSVKDGSWKATIPMDQSPLAGGVICERHAVVIASKRGSICLAELDNDVYTPRALRSESAPLRCISANTSWVVIGTDDGHCIVYRRRDSEICFAARYNVKAAVVTAAVNGLGNLVIVTLRGEICMWSENAIQAAPATSSDEIALTSEQATPGREATVTENQVEVLCTERKVEFGTQTDYDGMKLPAVSSGAPLFIAEASNKTDSSVRNGECSFPGDDGESGEPEPDPILYVPVSPVSEEATKLSTDESSTLEQGDTLPLDGTLCGTSGTAGSCVVAVAGLMEGPRMAQRKARYAVESVGRARGSSLERRRQFGEAEKSDAPTPVFDSVAYEEEHPLFANAIRLKHGINGTSFDFNTAVFGELPPLWPPSPERGDDLVDVTFERVVRGALKTQEKRQTEVTAPPTDTPLHRRLMIAVPPPCVLFSPKLSSLPPLSTVAPPLPLPPSPSFL